MLINDYKVVKKDDKDLAQQKILDDVFKMNGMNKIYLLGYVNAFNTILTVMNPKFTYEKKDILEILKGISEKSDDFNDVKEICKCIIEKHDNTI